MSAAARGSSRSGGLGGARIWLSASIPEEKSSTAEERQAILEFVRTFAMKVFQGGGHLLHGSHPSLVPTLLKVAKEHQEAGGRRDCLTLAVSRHWSKTPGTVAVDEWRKTALVYETPEAEGEQAREKSLEILREWMVLRCDAIVVVGGRWWHAAPGRAGLPLELGMATERGLPCFLLGGLGGAARSYLDENRQVLDQLKNGLDRTANEQLATDPDVGRLAETVCEQLERLPLVRGRGTDGSSFRILALDGGGLKGAFTAAVLAKWEAMTGLSVVDHFDLIAGTSTGGILAIGLGLGLSPQEMLNFYKEQGPTIFPFTRLAGRLASMAKHLRRPKYAQEVLLRELEAAYYQGKPASRLKDSRCRLVIPVYHAVGGTSQVLRTPHHSLVSGDAEIPVAEAALATAAAPTYFKAAKIATMVTESSYFDGGVWANSPAMAAIIEAVCFLRIPLERIDVLSVGTTDEPFTVRDQIRSGLFGWAWKKKILDLLMNVQQESSRKLARQLIEDGRFQRVDTQTVPGTYRLDSPAEIGELADLGAQRAQDPDILRQVKSRFLNGVRVEAWESFAPPPQASEGQHG